MVGMILALAEVLKVGTSTIMTSDARGQRVNVANLSRLVEVPWRDRWKVLGHWDLFESRTMETCWRPAAGGQPWTDGVSLLGHRSQVIADLSHQGYKVVLVTSGRVPLSG